MSVIVKLHICTSHAHFLMVLLVHHTESKFLNMSAFIVMLIGITLQNSRICRVTGCLVCLKNCGASCSICKLGLRAPDRWFLCHLSVGSLIGPPLTLWFYPAAVGDMCDLEQPCYIVHLYIKSKICLIRSW